MTLSKHKIYITCLGKANINQKDKRLKIITQIGSLLSKEKFTIIHSGYDTGVNSLLLKNISATDYSIGIPYLIFDKHYKRTEKTKFFKSQKTLGNRIDLFSNGDILLVLPCGGFGTLLEVMYIFHLNQVNSSLGGKTIPIIFYGKKWQKLMNDLQKNLDLTKKNPCDNLIFYVDSLSSLKKILIKMKNIIFYNKQHELTNKTCS